MTFDGGFKNPRYFLILCEKCYEMEDKRFLVSEETL